MTIRQLKNVYLVEFESFLELAKCSYKRTIGGHVIYESCDLTKPITFSNHVNPIPEFVIKNALRTLGLTKDDFFDILLGAKIMIEKSFLNNKCKKQFILKINVNPSK